MGPMPLTHQSLGIFVISIIFLGLTTISLSLRVFVRLCIVRNFGWDDATMVVAWTMFVGLSTCGIIGSMNGIGHHTSDFPTSTQYKKALMWWWLAQILYAWSSTIVRVSITVTLFRLTVTKLHRYILWIVITVTTLSGLVFFFFLLLNCKPVSFFWAKVDPSAAGSCISTKVLLDIAFAYSGLTVLCDMTLAILPAFLVHKLKMGRHTRIAVGAVLSMGALACVAVIVRIPFFKNLYYTDSDFLFSTFQIAICTILETGLAITTGSLITLRPLLRLVADKSFRGNEPLNHPVRYHQHSRSKSRSNALFAELDFMELNHPRSWRPDIQRDSKTVVTTVSSPRMGIFSHLSHGSQELLNSEDGIISIHHVNVHETITVEEGNSI